MGFYRILNTEETSSKTSARMPHREGIAKNQFITVISWHLIKTLPCEAWYAFSILAHQMLSQYLEEKRVTN